MQLEPTRADNQNASATTPGRASLVLSTTMPILRLKDVSLDVVTWATLSQLFMGVEVSYPALIVCAVAHVSVSLRQHHGDRCGPTHVDVL